MDWTYKFCAVMNVVTICILCFFRCAQRDIAEWTLIHMLLIKIIWFTQYLWISLLDGFCLTSIQGHSRYWSDSCGEGYKVFIFLFSLLQDFDQVVINFVQGGTSSLNQISLRHFLSTLALASAVQFSFVLFCFWWWRFVKAIYIVCINLLR